MCVRGGGAAGQAWCKWIERRGGVDGVGGGRTGVDAASGSFVLAFLPQIFSFLQHMSVGLACAPDALSPSVEAAGQCDLCGAPVPLCIHWKISSLHKNCLKNEICDYVLFISGLR